LPTVFPLIAWIPACECGRSGANVYMWVLAVIGIARRRGRGRLAPPALLGILGRAVTLARDPLERIDRQPCRG